MVKRVVDVAFERGQIVIIAHDAKDNSPNRSCSAAILWVIETESKPPEQITMVFIQMS